MISTTRWSPDTCKCIIEYSFDSSVPVAERVHTTTNIVACEIHQNEVDVHDVVLKENQGKNKAHKVLLDEATIEEVEIDGDGNRRFLEPPPFHYDENRNVVFTIKNKQRVFELDSKVKVVTPKSKVE